MQEEEGFGRFCNSGVDILQKKPKNAKGGINSALAKFPEIPKLSGFTPQKLGYYCFFAVNCPFLGLNNKIPYALECNPGFLFFVRGF